MIRDSFSYSSSGRPLTKYRVKLKGTEPPNHLWPALDLLENLLEAGLLQHVVLPGERAQTVERLRTAFACYGTLLDEDYLACFAKVTEALGQGSSGNSGTG